MWKVGGAARIGLYPRKVVYALTDIIFDSQTLMRVENESLMQLCGILLVLPTHLVAYSLVLSAYKTLTFVEKYQGF